MIAANSTLSRRAIQAVGPIEIELLAQLRMAKSFIACRATGIATFATKGCADGLSPIVTRRCLSMLEGVDKETAAGGGRDMVWE